MVDTSLVLDAIVAVSIAAGAIFAIMELRNMRKDRQVGIMLEVTNHMGTLEFQDAICRIWRSNAKDAKDLESQVSYTKLCMVGDYLESVAYYGTEGYLDLKMLAEQFGWETLWNKMRPWILAERIAAAFPEMWSGFEKLASLQKELKQV